MLDTATPILEITLLVLAIVSLDETRELVKTFAKTKTSDKEKRTHHVYILQDPQQKNITKYVGRTNDPDRRMREHKRDPLHPERKNYNMVVLVSGLTKEQAMVIEQILISAFTLGNLENARREISVGNLEQYKCYLTAAKDIIQAASEDALFDLMGE